MLVIMFSLSIIIVKVCGRTGNLSGGDLEYDP